MKKILTIAVSMILIAFCAFLLYLVYIVAFPQEKIVYDQTNRAFVVKGDVKVKKAVEGSTWQKMTTSTVLEKGDSVETGEDSSVDIIVGTDVDKAIRLDRKTSVRFESVNPPTVNCQKGKLFISVKKMEPRSSFTVRTPTIVCDAPTGAWLEDVNSTGTRISVFEGAVNGRELNDKGKPGMRKHKVEENTQIVFFKGKPMSVPEKIDPADAEYWRKWSKNIAYLREGKLLVNDFNKKENFNNIDGPFGSWNIFYSDPNQHCKDEFSASEKTGDSGYSLKLDYDVDSPYSAYNGFFTNLINIDISDYKYLVLSIKGDQAAGFTEKINLELKNQRQIGRYTLNGVTGEWKTHAIPLSKFTGITSFKDMKELVIVFSDINATKKTGVVYIDDIYFAKTEPAS